MILTYFVQHLATAHAINLSYCKYFLTVALKGYMNEIVLDHTDLQIMKMLQQDAWFSAKQIALTLKKGNTTISRKIERLKQLGYIKGSVALIDHSKVGEILTVFTQVHLNDHSSAALDAFRYSVISFEEVLECFQMTGSFDFLMKIMIPNMNAYQRFLREKLAQLDNVGAVQSHFVISEDKRRLSYPVSHL